LRRNSYIQVFFSAQVHSYNFQNFNRTMPYLKFLHLKGFHASSFNS
jgi:hypothetical protein